MKEGLKILLLEDSRTDAEMIRRVLEKDGTEMELRLVMNRNEFLQGLSEFQPNLILSDNSLPQFNATEALGVIREQQLHIPFILVTGTVSEEFAAGIIKLGADDYILKDRLTRLPSAIENALRQKRIEKEKQLSEEHLSAIFENTSEGFVLVDRDGTVKAFNENGKIYALYNTNKELAVGADLFDFVGTANTAFMHEMFDKVLEGEKIQYNNSYQVNDSSLWLNFTLTPVWKKGGIEGVCITGRDITEIKKAGNLQRAMEREHAVKEIQDQQKISRAIIKAQERERNHIGQELHDNVNQILAAAKIYMDKAAKDNPALEDSIQYPLQLIEMSMKEIRQLSSKLVTPLNDINLREMLQSLMDNLSENASIRADLSYDIQDSAENSDELKLNIYRIVQEQVNNIIKHSRADHVRVSVQGTGNTIKIVVEDNGKGFDMGQKRKGIGISNMINRVKSFNGEVTLDSAPGKGCRVAISIPR